MIPRCFALVAVALSSIHFAEALPVSSRELQLLADLPTPVDVGLPTSLPIPTESIPKNVPITNSLLLPTLTTAVPVSQTSVPTSDALEGILPSNVLVDDLLQKITDDQGLLPSLLAVLGSDKPVDLQGHTEDGVDLGGLGGLGGHNGGNLNL